MRVPTRSPYVFTEAKHAAWLKAGRGQGAGLAYRPWLECRNVKSRGRKHRLPGILHDRTLHLMSDLERNAVLHFEQQPQVLDIREQVPLDREVTLAIARAMGVRHPTDPVSGVHIVMTTDLAITFQGRSGVHLMRPFSVKESADLLKRRTREKQEIERRYWEGLGFRWAPLLDTYLRNLNYFNAILWAREWFYWPSTSPSVIELWESRCSLVLAELAAGRLRSLGELVRQVEQRGSFGPGEALSALRHLVARKRVSYDFALGTPTLATLTPAFEVRTGALRLAA